MENLLKEITRLKKDNDIFKEFIIMQGENLEKLQNRVEELEKNTDTAIDYDYSEKS